MVRTVVLASIAACAALILLLRSRQSATRRRQHAAAAATAARVSFPGAAPMTPGAPVAAGAPGAAPSRPRRHHDNRGLTHFAGPGTNEPRRARRVTR
jgi:hypothetical protein